VDDQINTRFINPTVTAPMPLTATFLRAEEQLRETLTDRRRSRRQHTAANDDRKPVRYVAPASTFRNSELVGDNSFFMSFDGEDEQAIHSLLTKRH
jgi:hypothetical protein